MRVRVAGIWKHPKSGIYWFRMAVPARHRATVGKREIKETLGTRSEVQARLKHAAILTEVTSLFARLDAEAEADVDETAKVICDRGFHVLARRNLAQHDDGVTTITEAMDNVLWGMLRFLTFRVRCTWGDDHALRAELELVGDSDGESWPAVPAAAFVDCESQDRIVERIRAFEGPSPSTALGSSLRGLAYRDVAGALLARQDWRFAEMEVTLVAEAARVAVVRGTRLYDAVAEQVLARLAAFRSDRTAPFGEMVAPVAPVAAGAPIREDIHGSARTLEDAFRQWCKNKNVHLGGNGLPHPPHKTADEWLSALRRFEKLFGPVALESITAEMVHDFRDILVKLPSRPKAAVSSLPLREQVVAAEAQRLRCLHPNSVKKQITAIQTMLGAAVTIGWLTRNVADGVKVEGAGYEGDERDFLTLEELRMIFASPIMTDSEACDDSTFFIILLETLQGGRPGELAKLKPKEVTVIDDTPTLRIRRGEGRRQKTAQSIRDVPLHDIAVAAGILELAKIRTAENADWLFNDLRPDKYGDRYKLLSRKINRLLRDLGIEDTDKCFYSARHTHKRESRRQGIAEANSDQMSGHSSGKSVGRKYGRGAPIETLKGDIDRVTYRGIDWEPVIKCGRDRIARLRGARSEAA